MSVYPDLQVKKALPRQEKTKVMLKPSAPSLGSLYPQLSESTEFPPDTLTVNELEKLREENEILRNALSVFSNKHFGSEDSEATARNWSSHVCQELDSAEGTTKFYAALMSVVNRPDFVKVIEKLREEEATAVSATGLTNKKYAAIVSTVNSSITLTNSDTQGEVGIVDLDSVDWWTMVPSVEEEVDEDSDMEEKVDESSYVFVNHEDVVEAMAEFVTECLIRVPETRKMDPGQLQRLLSGTFQELVEKTPVMKLWAWGIFLYSTYGWSSTIWQMYQNPFYVKLIMRALWTVGKFSAFIL